MSRAPGVSSRPGVRVRLQTRLGRLGVAIHAHPGRFVLAWALAAVAASFAAARLPDALTAGSGSIAADPSRAVEERLREGFASSFTRALYVVLATPRLSVDETELQTWLADTRSTLLALPEVAEVTCILDDPDPRLRSADGSTTYLLAGLAATSEEEEELAVPAVRTALAPLRERLLALDPDASLAVTGRAAITRDLNVAAQAASRRAETRALPLTFLVLVLAFGSLAAAGVPIAVGMVSTTLALALAYALTSVMPLSNLLPNVVTMLGLAVGIDYSLLMVTQFREEAGPDEGAAAMRGLLAEGGLAVLVSGATVLVGLVGLMLTDLLELRSMGIGGVLVVSVAVLAALTLVPALLALLGNHLEVPRALSRRLRPDASNARWQRLAASVMKRPLATIGLGLALLLVLSAPGLQARFGFDSSKRFFSPAMESRRGMELCERLGNPNILWPIQVLVRTTDGSGVLAPANLPRLTAIADDLRADPRVADVLSPVSLREDLGRMHYAILYADVERALERYPLIGRLLLSRDRSTALLHCVVRPDVTLKQAGELSAELSDLHPDGQLEVLVGGLPLYYRAFDAALLEAMPRVFGFVIGATLLLLAAAFRSLLIPIKAVLMNLLSVAAGFGVVVAVFQLGLGASLVGLDAPLDSIPMSVPVMLFCILFGISMDYEVFLLSRMKRVFDRTGDPRRATAEGLAGTGRLVTHAAAVMVIVFGAFVTADVVVVQMLGVGLAVAVLVDATIVRILLVPAFMSLAGRWNWWPGSR